MLLLFWETLPQNDMYTAANSKILFPCLQSPDTDISSPSALNKRALDYRMSLASPAHGNTLCDDGGLSATSAALVGSLPQRQHWQDGTHPFAPYIYIIYAQVSSPFSLIKNRRIHFRGH